MKVSRMQNKQQIYLTWSYQGGHYGINAAADPVSYDTTITAAAMIREGPPIHGGSGIAGTEIFLACRDQPITQCQTDGQKCLRRFEKNIGISARSSCYTRYITLPQEW